MTKQKVLYIVAAYPQISETYIKVEIETLASQYDLEIISINKANYAFEKPHPFHEINNYDDILNFAKKFKPDVIHTHWIDFQLERVFRLSKELNIPFTIRSHSFDTLWKPARWYKRILGGPVPAKVRKYIKMVNHPLCLGVLAFPYAVPKLITAGVKPERVVESGPVFAYDLFNDQSSNGQGIVNVGACLPKKKFEDYIHLATLVPDRKFHLYSLGYLTEDINNKNNAVGNPVLMHEPIQHYEVAKKLKDMQWMVYTADPELATVGLPLTLLEAQASGVGVCMRKLRPDLKEYLDGAVILYDSVEELVEIVKKPVSEQMRQRGFENARRYDIRTNIHQLTDLWDPLQAESSPKSGLK
ncbi:hypothetical protein [Amphritea sp. HPY]|uniref:hypothetical protein n=1 Tax=Amphritea sp. HPY TaxID=3421652 RepID=UPI003D7CFCCD